MTEDALTQLERLLVEERESIRRLDGAGVLAFAEQKEALVAALRGADGALSPGDASRLHALTPALRQNGVLLAHARDVLRDALAVVRADLGATVATAPAAAPAPRILSVRG